LHRFGDGRWLAVLTEIDREFEDVGFDEQLVKSEDLDGSVIRELLGTMRVRRPLGEPLGNASLVLRLDGDNHEGVSNAASSIGELCEPLREVVEGTFGCHRMITPFQSARY